jgi:hypothetical protein
MSQPAHAPGATDKALQPRQLPVQGMPPLGSEPPHGPITVQQQPEKPKRLGWPTVIINAVALLRLGSMVSGSGDQTRTPRPLLRRLVSATLAACAALALAGCNGIPRETPPPGWTLDVHQPGAWWEKPLIPRALIVERCAIKPTWGTNPDLSKLDALPPGSDVNLTYFMDEHHCDVGWQNAVSREPIPWADPQDEAWHRRLCSMSGLDLSDRGWRFLSRYDPQVSEHAEMPEFRYTNAAFVDEFDAVVTCGIIGEPGPDGGMMAGAAVKLQSAAQDAQPARVCPVHAEPWLFTNGPGSSARSVRVNGAGAVRDKAGAKMGDAEALRLHLPGDSVTVTIPVIEGIALADVDLTPTHPTPTDPAGQIALAGEVLDASGRTVATCG